LRLFSFCGYGLALAALALVVLALSNAPPPLNNLYFQSGDIKLCRLGVLRLPSLGDEELSIRGIKSDLKVNDKN